jgi:hypothetical protein
VYNITVIRGEVVEWFKAAVLKTAEGFTPSVGSNPTLSAKYIKDSRFPGTPLESGKQRDCKQIANLSPTKVIVPYFQKKSSSLWAASFCMLRRNVTIQIHRNGNCGVLTLLKQKCCMGVSKIEVTKRLRKVIKIVWRSVGFTKKQGCNPGKQVPKQFFDSLEHTNDGLGCRTNGCG